MSAQAGIIDLNFQAHARLMTALHRLLTAGQGESQAADEFRDRMDATWERLSPEQAECARGLSADLSSLRRGPIAAGQKEALVRQHFPAFLQAKAAGEQVELLKHLRAMAPLLPLAGVAAQRGFVWFQLGLYEVAYEFFQYARMKDPQNGYYAFFALESQARFDRPAALTYAQNVVSSHINHPVREVVKAASLLVENVLFESNGGPHQSTLALLTEVLEAIVLRMLMSNEAATSPVVFAAACAIGGTCSRLLGDRASALRFYDQGLAVSPNHSGLTHLRNELQSQNDLTEMETRNILEDLSSKLTDSIFSAPAA